MFDRVFVRRGSADSRQRLSTSPSSLPCPHPIGTQVIYRPKVANSDNSGYVGLEAVVTRHLHSKTGHTPPLLRECFIRFASGVTLLVPENDLVATGQS